MTAAKANRAPTEEDIRVAIEGAEQRYASDCAAASLREATQKVVDVLDDTGFDGVEDRSQPGSHSRIGLWEDLRPSQKARLRELLRAAQERANARAWTVIVDEIVAAGLEFGREFPDAPRAQRAMEA